jgi:hypothetical protein
MAYIYKEVDRKSLVASWYPSLEDLAGPVQTKREIEYADSGRFSSNQHRV